MGPARTVSGAAWTAADEQVPSGSSGTDQAGLRNPAGTQ